MNAQGRAGVPASLAEYGIDEIGCTVEHLRVLAKTGAAMDVALEAHNLADFVETAERCFELRQRVERADLGSLVTLLDRERVAEFARVEEPVTLPGKLTRGDDQIAGAHDRDISAHGRGRRRQHQSQFG